MRRSRWIIVLGVAAAVLVFGGVWWFTLRGECGWDRAIGRPGMDEPARSLAVFDDGTERSLYVGGFFAEAGGERIGRLARWDGERWNQVARGINGPVRSMIVFDDGNGSALYIAGQFTTLRGIEVNHIARFDGERWSPLGGGTNDWVLTLAICDAGDGPALYAAGEFTRAGDQEARYIARWDGEKWHPVGVGVDNSVNALTRIQTDEGDERLIAGGAFRQADDVPARHIAQWDGEQWSAMDAGLNDLVFALATLHRPDGSQRLIAGGRFTQVGYEADGLEVLRIAQWDGRSWSALGGGLDHEVHAMATPDAGSAGRYQQPILFVGGRFRRAGDVESSRLARWDGERWHAITPGPDERVQALVLDDAIGGASGSEPTLYLGGAFTSIGWRNANHIAAWRICDE